MRRLVALAALLSACGGELPYDATPSAAPSASAGQAGVSGTSGQSGQAGAPAAGAAGAAGQAGASGAAALHETLARCQGSDQAFVRRALQAVLGRRPHGQAEVQVYLDLMAGIDQAVDPARAVNGPPGADLRPARRIAVTQMMARDEFATHWIDTYRDLLRVQRTEEQANPGCYGLSKRSDGEAVALMVRDQPPDTTKGDGGGAFTMRDLLRSSLALDDVSPAYVGNLFAMLARTYAGANAEPLALELSRRRDFGAWFDGVYLHRDAVCLRCHNSEASVTFRDDPASNRHFPLPGRLEEALFGASTGPAPTADADEAARMHAPLRFDGVVSEQKGARPWGWAAACGTFVPRGKIGDDIALVDARFGALKGTKTSVWDLAASLQTGFGKLRQHGLSRAPGGAIPDPDEAFAYLVSAAIAEQVWREVMGTPLTIASYFPRNAAARDQLFALTEGLISSGFSHRQLLLQILQSPYFNLASLDDPCWPEPYPLPALFDPWTSAEQDPARRGNSPADAVVPRSGRGALQAAYRALYWGNPPASAFPDRASPEGEFQASIGIFSKNAEPGFRGLDFQGRLGWETRFGSCTPPAESPLLDYIELLVNEASQRPDATVGDLVTALKDRLIGEGAVADDDERASLEELLGAPLDAPASALADPDPALRRLCGVLLASPQFLMQGALPPDQSQLPALIPPAFRYEKLCAAVAEPGLPDGLQLACEGASLVVTRASE